MKAKEILVEEANVQKIDAPVTVISPIKESDMRRYSRPV